MGCWGVLGAPRQDRHSVSSATFAPKMAHVAVPLILRLILRIVVKPMPYLSFGTAARVGNSRVAPVCGAHTALLPATFKPMLKSALGLLLALAASLIFTQPASAWQGDPQSPNLPVGFVPDAMLMVIDHSGSMNEVINKGQDTRVRWAVVQQQAVETLRLLPLETHVWILIFSDENPDNPGTRPVPIVSRLASDRDRQILIDRLLTYPVPKGGTRLWDNVDRALVEAESLTAASPDRNISLMVFTDGEDSGSRKSSDDVKQRAGAARTSNPNLFLYRKQVGPDGADLGKLFEDRPLKITLPLRLSPQQVLLRNPRQTPRQELALTLEMTPDAQRILRGQRARYTIEPGRNGPRINGGEFLLEAGPVRIPLDVLNGESLQADEASSARLVITYPELPNHEISAGGGRQVELNFQPADRPQILQVVPATGATYPVGAEVLFFVQALQDSAVVWNLGDGVQRAGREVRYRYETPGPRKVTVTVSGAGGVAPVQHELELQILDLRLTVDPPPPVLFALQPQLLTVSTRGNVQRLTWLVDGQEFTGEPRADGQAGEQLRISLAEGTHEVSVRGYAAGREQELYSPKVPLVVQQQPALQILSPQQDQELYYEDHLTFVAVATGPVSAVAWTITDAAGEVLLAETETPVVESPEGRRAVLSVPAIPEVRPERAIRVSTRLIPLVGYDLAEIRREVSAVVRFTPFRGQIGLPTQPYPWKDLPAQLRLLTQSRFSRVRWNVVGTGLQSEERDPAFRLPAVGTFPITAEVTDLSNRTTVLHATLQVQAEPVTAVVRLLQGDSVPSVYYAGRDYRPDSSQSTGTIIEQKWLLDGQPLSVDQQTIRFDAPGQHVLKLVMCGPPPWVSGAPGHPGPAAEVTHELRFEVRLPPDLRSMLFCMLGAALGILLVTWCVQGNAALGWVLYYSNSPINPEAVSLLPRKKLRGRWSYFWKSAVFRFRELVSTLPVTAAGEEYWNRGGGSRQTLTVIGSGRTGATLLFSSQGEEGTDYYPIERSAELLSETWSDLRCSDKTAATWYVQVDHSKRGLLPDWLVWVLGLVAIVVSWILIYSRFFPSS